MPARRESCKTRVLVALGAPELGEERVARGELHPRGCMGARESHLDVDALGWGPLGDAARARGFHATCTSVGGGVVLHGGPLASPVRVRILEPRGLRLRCASRRAYVMATRRGMVYIAPLVWSTEAEEGNPKTPRRAGRRERRPRKRRA